MFKQFLAVLLLMVTAAQAWAQPLTDRVPADAVVYIGWRGADDAEMGYAGSNLQALGESADLPGALAQALETIQRANGGEPMVGLVVNLVRSIGAASWQKPTAAYLQPTLGSDLPVRFTVLWQAEGEQGDELMASLQELVGQAPPDAPLSIGQAEGLVSLTIGTPTPAPGDAPEGAPGDAPAATLAESARFTRSLAQVDSEGVLVIYVDAQGLLSMIDRAIEMEAGPREVEQWTKVRDALGLKGLNAAAWSGGFDGKDWRNELFIDAPAPRTGLLSLLDGEPISDEVLSAVPMEATWLAAVRLDLGVLLDQARRVIREIDPNAAQQFEDALLQGNQMTGIDIEADLLRALGSAWVLYTDPGAIGSGMMGVCLVNPLNDAEAAERSLMSLQAIANALMGQAGAQAGMRIRFHTSDDNGMTLNTLGVPFVGPTWSVYEGKLYVGLYPQTVMMAGDRARAGGPSILDNEKFQAMMARLNGGEASSIVYTDLTVTAEDAYQNIVMMAQVGSGLLAMFGGDSVPTLVPSFARIQPLLSPTGQIAWSDDAGYHSRAISPFPGAVLLGPQGSMNSMSTAPILVGTLLPALGASRRAARQMKSTTQCRGIVQSQVMFGSDNDDRMSNDIAELYEQNYFDIQYLISPSAPVAIPRDIREWPMEDQKQWVRQNASYILIPDRMVDINTEIFCVFERPDHSDGGGIPVGRNDGSASFEQMWNAREMIEAQTGMTLEQLVHRQQNYTTPPEAPAQP